MFWSVITKVGFPDDLQIAPMLHIHQVNPARRHAVQVGAQPGRMPEGEIALQDGGHVVGGGKEHGVAAAVVKVDDEAVLVGILLAREV